MKLKHSLYCHICLILSCYTLAKTKCIHGRMSMTLGKINLVCVGLALIVLLVLQ